MAEAYTGPDGLGVFLSSGHGCGDGLGGGFCPVEFEGVHGFVTGCSAGQLRIERVSQGVDWRWLRVDARQDTVTGLWEARLCGPGTEGEWGPVAAGGRYLLAAGDWWARVFWDGHGEGRTGDLTVRPVVHRGGAAGMAGTTRAERAAHGYQHRLVWLYGREGVVVDSIEGACTLGTAEWWLGDAVESGDAEVIADGWTAPAGASWSESGTPAAAIAAGWRRPLWLRLGVEEESHGVGLAVWSVGYTVGGESYSTLLAGQVLAADDTVAGWRVYLDDTGTETAGGALAAEGASLPLRVTVTPPVSGTAEFRARATRVNRYGLENLCRGLGIIALVDAEGADVSTPARPMDVTARDGGGGVVKVQGRYFDMQYRPAADGFRVRWWVNGEALVSADFGLGVLTDEGYFFEAALGPFSWGDSVSVEVVTFCGAAGEVESEAAEAGPVSVTSFAGGAGAERHGLAWTVGGGEKFPPLEGEAWGDVSLTVSPGGLALLLDGDAGLLAQCSEFGERLLTPFLLADTDTLPAAASGTAAVETDGEVVYLCAGGMRAAALDFGAGELLAGRFDEGPAPDCPLPGPVVETAAGTFWRVWDARAERWRTALAVTPDGALWIGLDLEQTA